MPKRSQVRVRHAYAATPRSKREAWRSLTICTIKVIFYGTNALVFSSLITQLGWSYPSLALFPPLIFYRLFLPMSSAYFVLKVLLAVAEYRHGGQIEQAEASSAPRPIALTSLLALLYPWWVERQLKPYTVIVRHPSESQVDQSGREVQEFASPVIAVRIHLFNVFRIVLVGADGKEAEITLHRKRQRYVGLIALLAVHNDGDMVPVEKILDTLYKKFAKPRDSFDKDRSRILDYINEAALLGGFLPLEELFVNHKVGVNQVACWGLAPLCDVELLPQLRDWEQKIQKAAAEGVELDHGEVTNMCQRIFQSYGRGLLASHWKKDTLPRDIVWWWVKKPFLTARNSTLSLLRYAAQLEVARADQQPPAIRQTLLKQAAIYYEHAMVFSLRGIPDAAGAEQFLARCQATYRLAQDERAVERVKFRYDELLRKSRPKDTEL